MRAPRTSSDKHIIPVLGLLKRGRLGRSLLRPRGLGVREQVLTALLLVAMEDPAAWEEEGLLGLLEEDVQEELM